PFDELTSLPCAHGGPAGRAQLRAAPEDFLVQEWLGWEADGAGDHLLLKVRKRGANTLWIAKQLARLGKIDPRDVGFAGLKDRDAVAEQSFTVPARSAVGESWVGLSGEGFEVVACTRHRRKLKRGALKGNDFTITLRAFNGDPTLLAQRLQSIAVGGVPNYFGPQRFGRDGGNLRTAFAWFADGVAPTDRWQRSFALSASRAAIFNAVVARRVSDRTWNELLPGEIVNLDGSGSVFVAEVIDAALAERCAQRSASAASMTSATKMLPLPSRLTISPGNSSFQVLSLTRRATTALKIAARDADKAKLRCQRSVGATPSANHANAVRRLPPSRPKRCGPK